MEDSRRRLQKLKAKTECRACGRKGHWTHDREYAMSCSSSSIQTNSSYVDTTTSVQPSEQVGVCFVLNDYSDDPDTSGYMVGQNVPLPPESAKQTPMTPTASAAVDTKKEGIFDGHAMNDNDEPWLSTFHIGTKSSRAERIVVCCMKLFWEIIRNTLYHWPRQRVYWQTCVNFSLGHKDLIALT